MLTENELRYTLALQRVPNLGDTSAKKLLHHVGSAEGVFKEKKENLLKIDGIGRFKVKEISEKKYLDLAEQELDFIKKERLQYRYYKDPLYPERLKHCLDGPILFFEKGNIHLENRKIISIVGTRKITTYGVQMCEKIIKELVPFNPIIVSGFAYGVDITAHKAAIEHKLQTVACLAHGMNQIYPKVHKKYTDAVAENGGFITEFWSNDPFDRTNFLKRNRIIAGMSEATIIIESAAKGGSLVTADIANSYNRDVFAVPGRATDTQSEGCNMLVKTNSAHVCTGAEDLIFMLDWELEQPSKKEIQPSLFVAMDEFEHRIYAILKKKDKELLDIIAIESGMPTYRVASILLNLELKGIVKPLPGKLFQLA